MAESRDGRQLPDFDWPDETVAWFESWRDSPRSSEWDDVQWQYLFDTALVHAAVWGGDMSLLPELRARLQYMGLTFERERQAKAAPPAPQDSGDVLDLDEILQRQADERRGRRKRRGA